LWGWRIRIGVDSKAAVVRSYGAFEVVNYTKEDLRERIKALTDHRVMTGGEAARFLVALKADLEQPS
jgi:NADPH:quinone reductase-like Zn-dependent oxidoreductase